MIGWEINIGIFPGLLVGARTYRGEGMNNHVLYLLFIDICLTTYFEENESDQ